MTKPPAAALRPASRGRATALGMALALLAAAGWAWFDGRLAFRIPALQAWALRDVPPAACATLAGLLLAAPLAAWRATSAWLLVPWMLLLAGMRLLTAPVGPASAIAHVSVLALPLMLLMLQRAWSRIPAGLYRAAAAAGAPPVARLALRLRLAAPGAAQACAIGGLLCLALIGRPGAAP